MRTHYFEQEEADKNDMLLEMAKKSCVEIYEIQKKALKDSFNNSEVQKK